MAKPLTRFCPTGHDTEKTGRRPAYKIHGSRACVVCHLENRRRWRINQKIWAVEHKGGRCMDCRMKFGKRYECAQFDHFKGRKVPRGFDLMVMSRTRLIKELKQCALVCANCHATRTRKRLEAAA